MKKQFFLLSLLLAAFNATTIVADCDTKCKTSCETDTCSSSACAPEHGHTFMSITPEFGAASPERVALFESHKAHHLKHDEKHGAFQVVVFGGKNTKGSQTAGYFLPYGHTSLNFDGSIKEEKFASALAESVSLIACSDGGTSCTITPDVTDNEEINFTGNGSTVGQENIFTDPVTFKFDGNKDTSKILPWNFGITYAALFEPRGSEKSGAKIGSGLITAPTFKSKISPCARRWHIGAGMELAYHFSDDVTKGWFGKLSTAVQHARTKISLNEDNQTEKQDLKKGSALDVAGNPAGISSSSTVVEVGAQYVGSNGSTYNATRLADTTPVGSIAEAYLGRHGSTPDYYATTFPTDDTKAPNSVEEAFAQEAWNYGKIGCEQRITRLADIELSLGYLWTCGDCASTTFEAGIVIPAGNKPSAEFVMPAVVGNNQHVGIRMGSTTAVMLSENDESSTWARLDVDTRYLFRNTQKRSFDVNGKEWSRYMMVWKDKDAYSTALTALVQPLVDTDFVDTMNPQRGYTPGINVFTTDFYVKPQFQGRLNSALMYQGEKFRAELGWNVHMRQKECVELACAWDSKPAFADSSYIGGVGLNNHRTIFNDAQTAATNVVDSLARGYTADALALLTTTNPISPYGTIAASTDAALARYDGFALTDADINYDSVASVAYASHTPYATLGYAFDYDCHPTLSLGASYEFTASNRGLNQWMVWGKFEVAF